MLMKRNIIKMSILLKFIYTSKQTDQNFTKCFCRKWQKCDIKSYYEKAKI